MQDAEIVLSDTEIPKNRLGSMGLCLCAGHPLIDQCILSRKGTTLLQISWLITGTMAKMTSAA